MHDVVGVGRAGTVADMRSSSNIQPDGCPVVSLLFLPRGDDNLDEYNQLHQQYLILSEAEAERGIRHCLCPRKFACTAWLGNKITVTSLSPAVQESASFSSCIRSHRLN